MRDRLRLLLLIVSLLLAFAACDKAEAPAAEDRTAANKATADKADEEGPAGGEGGRAEEGEKAAPSADPSAAAPVSPGPTAAPSEADDSDEEAPPADAAPPPSPGKDAAASVGVLGELAGDSAGADGKPGGGIGTSGIGRGGGGTGEGGGIGSIGTGGLGAGKGGYGKHGGLGEKRSITPKVVAASPVVQGSLDKDIIRRVIRRHQNEVKYCYERVLVKQPDLAGKVDLKFVIDSAGNVSSSSITKSTIGNAEVEQCVAARAQRWKFPQPTGGGIVVVNYPFVFTTGEARVDPDDIKRREADLLRIEEERRRAEERRRQEAQSRAGRLTAGEWRDLDNWDFWRALFDSNQNQQEGGWTHMERTWGFNTAQRVRVEVTGDRNGTPGPITDAAVQLLGQDQRVIWEARTDNKGRADLYAGLFGASQGPYVLVASSGQGRAQMAKVVPNANETLSLHLKDAAPARNGVDIMFMVDTTGSMGDELSFLQAEMQSVIDQVQQKNGQQLGIRTSVNFYRDQGDDYVVRPFDFTDRLGDSLKALGDQYASGGGDFPEAVEEALDNAVNSHPWSASARARLLFLVLDAPPHNNPQILQRLHDVTQRAAAKGIRIIPIGGSGINKDTEFLMRFVAVATSGTYVFLTDHSGVGGSHIKPTIGPHKVEQLNALLIRLINDALG